MSKDVHDVKNWVPIAEAVWQLQTTQLNVLMHIKRGLLVGVEQEDGWLVDSESLAGLIRQRASGELPAVCRSGCIEKAGGCGSCG